MSHRFALESCRSILCFGDSLTGGYSPAEKSFHPYCHRLAERLQARGAQSTVIVNSGVSGEDTQAMLERLPKRLSQGPPAACGAQHFDLVIIFGGVNDLTAVPHDSEIILRNLLELHEMARRSGAQTGIVTLPRIRTKKLQAEIDANRRWINTRLCDFALRRRESALFVDLAAALPQDDGHAGLWDPDGLHLSPEGYAALGDLIDESANTDLRHLPMEGPTSSTTGREGGMPDLGVAMSSLVPGLFADPTWEIIPPDPGVNAASLLLRWAMPADPHEAAVRQSRIELRNGRADGSVLASVDVPHPRTAARFCPLWPGHLYHVSLTAVGDDGAGPPVVALVQVPDELCIEDPRHLQGCLQAVHTGQQLVHLQWPVPISTSELVGYRVWYRVHGTEAWEVLVENTGCLEPSLRCSVPAGRTFEFHVAAICRVRAQSGYFENGIQTHEVPASPC
mmetsp:Transcript_87213/g.241882  ORF Transcript_87213/g.241882 Transcript_87213/m.241882 type:complete len:451 (+) Transcript_87213:132-1484(+)